LATLVPYLTRQQLHKQVFFGCRGGVSTAGEVRVTRLNAKTSSIAFCHSHISVLETLD
jgi:hypothetical protein